MIVIATNNGKPYLLELLSDFQRIGVSDEISIIDTQSTDIESLEFLESLKIKNDFGLKINVYQTPYRGFDTGAYIYAINNLKSDKFYFMQDSIKIKSIEYFNEINKRLKVGTVVPLITFGPHLYDENEQIIFCYENFDSIEYDKGIFGPIFAITNEDVRKIDKKYLVYPTNKMLQMGMERGWSVLFKKYGFEIEPIEGAYDYMKLSNDGYSLFKKLLPYRR
jgi:hypothetical protein